jgi:class 3 adenylate cyclase/pimeloyl-ACP methyl ester carboxylesterase
VGIEPQIRYAQTADGVSIAYWTLGEGRPVFMNSPLTFSHSGLEVRIPRIAALYERIATNAMLVRWDMRNYGMSQRGVERLGLDDWAADVFAVADKLGVDEFDFVGINYHPTVAALQPERVRRVALVHAVPLRLAPLLDDPNQAAVRSLASTNWEVFTETHASFLQAWNPDPSLPIAHFIRESIDQEDYLRVMAAWREWDFTPYLSRISCPTLIVTVADTAPLYRDAAREYAAGIARSTLVTTEGSQPIQSADGWDVVESFISDGSAVPTHRAAPSAAEIGTPHRFRTVLFTDIVDHTAMMQRLGDDRGRAVVREHERITREVLARHGGAEIKTLGDGFLASFDSLTGAVHCAIALQRAFAARRSDEPISIRIGMNAGEPIEEDGDLFGSTVILASRIAGSAGPGQILVPEAVRHLVAGKSFAFEDRGDFTLKGFDEPVRLFEVGWQTGDGDAGASGETRRLRR